MTGLFRMSISALFQALSLLVRTVLFFFLAILKPLDYMSSWLQRIAVWLAVDEDIIHMVEKHQSISKEDIDER